MAHNREPEKIPKKNRPHDKSHVFHANQEGLFDIEHDDVSSPPTTGGGFNPQHGDDELDKNRQDNEGGPVNRRDRAH